jgi:phospholipid/cholesterol/gamma-HCH transport system permease protein
VKRLRVKVSEAELPEEISPEWLSREHDRIVRRASGGSLRLDCRRLRKLDSLGMAWLGRLQGYLEGTGGRLVLANLPADLRDDLDKISAPEPSEEPHRVPDPLSVRVGAEAYEFAAQARNTLVLLSESLYWSTFGAFRRKTLIPEDTLIQMVRLGSSALPIVLLLSGLIGFTLALQSGIQLAKFGASIFLASGIGISMVTEIGPVMTAVILAGRSGSSITAEIATMTVQEEVGALQSMAINPVHYLVLPRFWAMSLTLPLLTVCSAMAGIFAGLVVGFFFFRLSPASFFSELQNSVTINYIGQALVKSLTFAWIITLVAIEKGISVRGGADAVGRATTSCVVTCIASIIVADAVFSFIFYF